MGPSCFRLLPFCRGQLLVQVQVLVLMLVLLEAHRAAPICGNCGPYSCGPEYYSCGPFEYLSWCCLLPNDLPAPLPPPW